MARRMFSDEITTTDAFLDMPGGSQLLYFHLGINADDDGFISSPKMIMRAIGASDDELKILYAKKFLLPFASGVCVVKHWRINNQIRKDRYTETVYTKEKMQLFIRDNGSYTFNPDNALPVPRGHFLALGNQLATTGRPLVAVVEESIVEESRVKDKIVKNINDNSFDIFWKSYPVKKGKGTAEKAWSKYKPNLEIVLSAIEKQKQSDQWIKDKGKFIPYPATWLNGKRWEDEVEVTTNSKFAKYDS